MTGGKDEEALLLQTPRSGPGDNKGPSARRGWLPCLILLLVHLTSSTSICMLVVKSSRKSALGRGSRGGANHEAQIGAAATSNARECLEPGPGTCSQRSVWVRPRALGPWRRCE